MVVISTEEKEIIRTFFPNAHIVRTMKKKSKRHKYYCEESRKIMVFLNRLREDRRNLSESGDINERREETK